MPDDDGEAIAQEVLKEDANHERGERPEWATHEGWHRREDTGRFGTAARARAAQRDAEAKKKKLYHEGWEAEADASAEAPMAPRAARDYVADAAAESGAARRPSPPRTTSPACAAADPNLSSSASCATTGDDGGGAARRRDAAPVVVVNGLAARRPPRTPKLGLVCHVKTVLHALLLLGLGPAMDYVTLGARGLGQVPRSGGGGAIVRRRLLGVDPEHLPIAAKGAEGAGKVLRRRGGLHDSLVGQRRQGAPHPAPFKPRSHGGRFCWMWTHPERDAVNRAGRFVQVLHALDAHGPAARRRTRRGADAFNQAPTSSVAGASGSCAVTGVALGICFSRISPAFTASASSCATSPSPLPMVHSVHTFSPQTLMGTPRYRVSSSIMMPIILRMPPTVVGNVFAVRSSASGTLSSMARSPSAWNEAEGGAPPC